MDDKMDAGAPIGQWIRQRRLSLDLTQEELAGRVGCSADMIGKIETGTRRPSRQIALLLAEALEVVPEERTLFVRLARHVSEMSESPHAKAGVVGDGVAATGELTPEAEINPYKGLQAFDEADAPFFFGREAFSQRLRGRLAEDAELGRFL